jgi:hypothetical protein
MKQADVSRCLCRSVELTDTCPDVALVVSYSATSLNNLNMCIIGKMHVFSFHDVTTL